MRHLTLLIFAGCASAPAPNGAPKEITRTEIPQDLSGEWNDVDADLVARAIIDECLKSDWVERWSKEHEGKRPALRLIPIRNRTTAYIDYRFFTKQIEAALVRSGKIDVISAAEESGPATSDGESDSRPVYDAGGADFVLSGWIVSQDDKAGDKEVRAYLTSVEIIDAKTQRKAWVGQKQIRKLLQH